jgi:predicted DNA-binding transcriptional regulator AlpA
VSEPTEIVDSSELAELLRTSVHTVHYWRHQGTGPKGFKVGKRILYRWSDVEAWLDQKAADDVMADRPQHRTPAGRRAPQMSRRPTGSTER